MGCYQYLACLHLTKPWRRVHQAAGGVAVARDLSKMLPPDHPMYTDAVEALKRYHQAQADGVSGSELERLRLIAEHQFQAVTDYQLGALGGPTPRSH